GVPVVFPQFSDRGALPRHGLARTRAWQLRSDSDLADGGASVVLGLACDAQSRALWPYAFELELQVRLYAQTLEITLQCTNTDTQPWPFMAALHTYLQVDDCTQAQISGLAGRSYWDALDAQDKTQDAAMLGFPGEVDRVYAGVADALTLHDHADGAGRSVEVTHSGFADVVVWNPGPQRCATLSDMPPDGYRAMVCIESARIAQPVTLAPAQVWAGMQRLRLLA
ncbi:MAG: D-hexose-6-phosphate mutarotase, partial [Burkholderiaceae bacterium]